MFNNLIFKILLSKIYIIISLITGFSFFLCSNTINGQDQLIKTPSSQYQLKSVPTLKNDVSVRSAARTVELATNDLNQVISALQNENEAISVKIAEHNKKADDLEKDKAVYSKGADNYAVKLDNYTPRLNKYESDLTENSSAIDQYNARPSEQRDGPTADRLNAEHSRLLGVKKQLDDEYWILKAQHDQLQYDKANLEKRITDLNYESASLNEQAASVKTKLGQAYQQLKLCYDYANRLREVMKRYPDIPLNNSPFDVAAEKLKELSNEGFDK